MKKFVRIVASTLFLWVQVFSAHAQNSLNSGDFVGGSWGVGQSMSASAGGSLIITKSVSSSGDKFFRFYGDGSPCGEYQPNSNGDAFISGTLVTTPNGNCGSSNAWKINVPTASSNVVFKTDGNNTGISKSIAFVVQGTVQTFSSHTAPTSSSVYPGATRRLTVTLSGMLNTGQVAYIRYHNGAGFGSATIAALTYSGTGNDYFVDIPASVNSVGSTVIYYFFTSGTTVPSNADADLYTINLLNNSGSNYSYTVSGTWQTANAGSWGTAATWNANAVPPTAQSMGAVTVGHNVTLDQDATVTSITINSGVTLTGSDGSARTLTVASGGTFTNNSSTSGGYNATATGNVTFAGSGTMAGSQSTTFNTAVLNGALTGSFSVASGGTVTMNSTSSVSGTVTTVGSATFNGSAGASSFASLTLNGTLTLTKSSTINGTLTMNSGASVTSNSPTYGASSTLVYATAMTEGLEWPSASGPQNVTLNSSIGTVALSANVHVNGGTLTINSGATLDVSASNYSVTLASGGSFANSGTFTARNGTVAFSGSGTISGTNSFYNVTIAGGVNFGAASTIGSGGSLQINAGGFVNTNAPSYHATSTLIYNTTGTYGRGLEWSATSGAGYPGNVTITNSTTLNIGNNGTSTARQCAGTLTINSGSTFSMNVSAMTAAVTVIGNVLNSGSLTLSGSSGGDLYVAGNFTNNGTFTHNSRAVFFNGITQTIAGSNLNSSGSTNSFAFVRINSGANVTLGAAVTVNKG